MTKSYHGQTLPFVKALIASLGITILIFFVVGVATLNMTYSLVAGAVSLAILLFIVVRPGFSIMRCRVEITPEVLLIRDGRDLLTYPRDEYHFFALSYDSERQVIQAERTTRVSFAKEINLRFLSRNDYWALLKDLNIIVGRK